MDIKLGLETSFPSSLNLAFRKENQCLFRKLSLRVPDQVAGSLASGTPRAHEQGSSVAATHSLWPFPHSKIRVDPKICSVLRLANLPSTCDTGPSPRPFLPPFTRTLTPYCVPGTHTPVRPVARLEDPALARLCLGVRGTLVPDAPLLCSPPNWNKWGRLTVVAPRHVHLRC